MEKKLGKRKKIVGVWEQNVGSLGNLVLHLYRDAVAGEEDGDGAVHCHRQREDEEPAPAT